MASLSKSEANRRCVRIKVLADSESRLRSCFDSESKLFICSFLFAETSEKCLAISKVLSVVAETLLDIDEVVALCPLMQHFCRHQQHGDYLTLLFTYVLDTRYEPVF